MNSAATHKVQPGDRVSIGCYAPVPETKLEGHQPVLAYCGELDRMSHTHTPTPPDKSPEPDATTLAKYSIFRHRDNGKAPNTRTVYS